MPLKRLVPIVWLAACAAPEPPKPAPAPAGVDTLALRAHTWFLSQDLLRGRGTGDTMTLVAANYIEAQCRALGLDPVGDRYQHDLPLVDAGLGPSSRAVVHRGTDSVVARHGQDFVVTGGALDALGRPVSGPAIWLGDPDSLPPSLPDLSGRVGVLLGVADPSAATRLAHAGAAALVSLVGDDRALARFGSAFGTPLRFRESVPSSFFPPLPVLVGGTRLTRALAPVARGARLRVAITLDPAPREIPATNVACRLTGDDPALADTAIAFTAHYDHLGIGPVVEGDSIYNGFSDNAAGVAMLLGIAEVLRRDRARFGPRHSVLFLFFSGEERGLLGSDWWVARPPWPLDRMRAVINLDAGAPPGRVWSWQLAGGTASWLGPLGQDVAARHGWAATLSEPRANSDYFPFLRHGVPAVFPIPTPAPYEGITTDSSVALRRRWDRYHRTTDEWHAGFPFAGLQRYAEYALWIGMAVDTRQND